MKTVMQKRIMNFQLDSFNMVHHARYLEFMEEGRWQYCYENNLMDEYQSRGIYHVVVNININYRSSATMGDLITISTELFRITEKSVIFKQTALRDETILVEADIMDVFLNKTNHAVIAAKEMASFWDDLKLLL
jgi:thioesterase-3